MNSTTKAKEAMPRAGVPRRPRQGSDGELARTSNSDNNNSSSISLLQVDVATVEARDPSLVGGWRIVYERECPFELRKQRTVESPQEVGTLEAVKVKLLMLGPENSPEALKAEVSSESNLFFHYSYTVDEEGFRVLQEEQKLMVEFEEFARVLVHMLNDCIDQPDTHMAVFVLHEEGPGRLDFIQNMEYRFVELLTCSFAPSDEELVRQHITYRYDAVKARLGETRSRLTEMHALVKAKNPSLLLKVRRAPQEV